MPEEPLPVRAVLEFWAPWCAASQPMVLHMAALAAELEPRVAFSRINADTSPEALEERRVRVLPTLLFLDAKGREVSRLEGEIGCEEDIRGMIEGYFASARGI